MDTTTLVEKQIQEGRDFILELDKRAFEIKAAFWVYDENYSSWKLMIASSSDKLDITQGSRKAHGTIINVLSSMKNPSYLSSSDVILISLTHPLITNLAPLINTGNEIANMRFSNTLLNQIYFEGIYLYRMNVQAQPS